MTNYEKLCEEAGIKPEWRDYRVKNGKVYNSKNPKNRNIRFLNPDFTAEKQIELIKLLAVTESFTLDFSEIPPRNDNEQWACMCKFKSAFSADFSEALAGLTLQLIKASELDKEEVRKVLK